MATNHGGLTIDIVDPAEITLPAVHPAFGTAATPELATLGERLSAADAFVVVTADALHIGTTDASSYNLDRFSQRLSRRM